MRIIYVAKHDSGGNDDEGAIAHALEQLGHEVIRIRESQAWKATYYNGDLLLFHKWQGARLLPKLSYPKVFWYFDLVDYPDPTLHTRCFQRRNWMMETIPLVDLGFCTDGDWVSTYGSDKLIHLPQGADERVIGIGEPRNLPEIPILFTGISKGGGSGRESFVRLLETSFPGLFHHVRSGCYGRSMADLVSRSKLVVAPDEPVTDRYWSNRVYVTLGYGGFLLHPYTEGLVKSYHDGTEIVFYHSREELLEKIDHYLNHPKADEIRRNTGFAAFRRTLKEHTYRHRCETLIQTVRNRLKLRS